MKSLLIYDGDYRIRVAMAKAKKSKDADVEKLRRILDTNGEVDEAEVDELLKSVELRLKGKKKPTSSYKKSSKRPDYVSTQSRNLKPSVSVGSLKQPTEEKAPESQPAAGSCVIDPPSFDPADFKVKDLYEIVYPSSDEETLFVEVKTKQKVQPATIGEKKPASEQKTVETVSKPVVEEKKEEKTMPAPSPVKKQQPEEEVLEEWKLVEEPLAASEKKQSGFSIVSKKETEEVEAKEEKKPKLSLKSPLKRPHAEEPKEKPIVKAQPVVEEVKIEAKAEEPTVVEKPKPETDKKNKIFLEAFKGISCIDETTASLLYEHNITSPSDIRETKISDLTKIKGIRRKFAKEMKKQAESLPDTKSSSASTVSSAMQMESTEWIPDEAEDTCVPEEKPEKTMKKDSKPPVEKASVDDGVLYRYGEYGLYRKEMVTSTGKARVIHFFSKTKPDIGEPVALPDGYEVKVNKKTGLPSLKKKK